MTCPLPPDFVPDQDQCTPPNFEQYCASLDPPRLPIPLWWRNACVSYDVQQNASGQLPYDVAVTALRAAFATWTSTTCPVSGGAQARVSIEAVDFGPVACNQVRYNVDQPNQHVIVFDNPWPHNDSSNTLGLTTITYDVGTGEIFDADMEINAEKGLSTTDSVPTGAYDLASIVTHETGHFLGLAHSSDPTATMYASYFPGSTNKRVLTSDDVDGICTIYPADGTRSVLTPAGSPASVLAATCDPTPRHGFQSACQQSTSVDVFSCSLGAVGRSRRLGIVLATLLLAAGLIARRTPSIGRAPRPTARR